jgi:hypothetical protein
MRVEEEESPYPGEGETHVALFSERRQNNVHSTQEGVEVAVRQLAVDLDDVLEAGQHDPLEVASNPSDEVQEKRVR